MPNIRILAQVVLKIFCSQGCSYTKCLCPNKGITQPKIYRIGSKVNQFIYILVCNYIYMPNIRIQALTFFSDILLTRLFIHSRKRGIIPERQDRRRKKKYGSAYFSCTCHIHMYKISRLQHKRFLSFSAAKKCHGQTDGQTDRQMGIGSKVNQFIYTLVCNYMLNIRILAKAVLKIFCSQGCSYTKCLCPKKGNNSTENLRNRFKS